MVRLLILAFLFFSSALAIEVQKSEDLLIAKIKTLIEPSTFSKDRAFIDIIFSPKKEYYKSDGTVDSVKVIQTLKENGLLKLFFKKPQEINMNFKTDGAPLFFVKIMSDTLRNIGYYRYVTKESNLGESEFVWKISLVSEYAADPLVLSLELQKSGCRIVDVRRDSKNEWTYLIDMEDARLNVETLEDAQEVRLKRSLDAYWLNVSKVDKVDISSSARNDWYPYIAYYDKYLNLLRVIKIDRKRNYITLNMRQNTHYIKISDIYTLKNIKDDLVLKPALLK